MDDATLQKAHRAFVKAAEGTDIPWRNYQRARARQAQNRGVFAAEQGLIDASQAVGRAQARLDEKYSALHAAAVREACRGIGRYLTCAEAEQRADEICTALGL